MEGKMAEIDASLRRESKDRYLTYALSVVTGRALPDVRDGLKPVQRRILYAMLHNLNLKPTNSHRKSAAVVGEVLARFHPHGDTACYEAMVRMAQDFSMRYPLVDGQGNFGSVDGDSAAAYRYTEARLLPLALEVVGEIDQETVNYRDNFDSTTQEPEVLPSRVPNLLMNGASGIAVGMATNIPPHNLRDIVACILELAKDPEVTVSRLTTLLKGPDFPTSCDILNTRNELIDIYQSGRGTIRMRAVWKLEELSRGKKAIVVTAIPFATNKSQLIEKVADLIISKKVPQLIDVRDESTEDVRVVLELNSGADPEVAMAYLFKHTPLESNFYANFTALTPNNGGSGKPELLSLKQCLQHFLDFRQEVTICRLEFEKKNLLARIHILEGFVKIFDSLDEALKIVRESSGRSDSATKLKKRFKLSDEQAFAIVDMRIYQLARTNIEDIRKELNEKESRVKQINVLLKSKKKILALVSKELQEIADTFGDKRKSRIVKDDFELEFNAADYIVQEEVYTIVTRDGWMKKIRQNNDPNQTRIREGDQILQALPLTTLDSIVLFTNLGFIYSLPVTEITSSSGYGDPVQKLLKFKDGEKIIGVFSILSEETQPSLLPLEEQVIKDGDTIVLLSKKGMGYVLELQDLQGLKKNGRRVMKFRGDDELAALASTAPRISMFTHQGSALSIDRKSVPTRSNSAIGVSLMGVRSGDHIVSLVCHNPADKIEIFPDGGKAKILTSKDLPKGKRALKGKKVVSRHKLLAARIKA